MKLFLSIDSVCLFILIYSTLLSMPVKNIYFLQLTKIRPFPGNDTIDGSLALFSLVLNGRDLM